MRCNWKRLWPSLLLAVALAPHHGERFDTAHDRAPGVPATLLPATSLPEPLSSAEEHERHIFDSQVQLCQAPSPAAPYPVPYVDCVGGNCQGNLNLEMVSPQQFQAYAQGEYVGRARLQHVTEYRLRVDDQLDFVYRLTRDETPHPYEINVGDEVRVESFTDKNLDRILIVQPDGTITLPLLGQVRATRHSVAQLRDVLEERFKKFYKVPAINVTPLKVNTKLDDLRNTVGGRSGFGSQVRPGKVTPEGTIALPAIGSFPAQGLTLEELTRELAARYTVAVEGVEVTPVLTQRAPRFVYVLGECKLPGRYTLEAPTTVMQAIALAGSWNFGANVKQVVIFRRADDWRLIATMVDVRAALLGRTPCPAGEIWVSDSDLIILPKTPIQLTDNWIELIFTKGLYAIAPFSGSVSFTNLSTLNAVR